MKEEHKKYLEPLLSMNFIIKRIDNIYMLSDSDGEIILVINTKQYEDNDIWGMHISYEGYRDIDIPAIYNEAVRALLTSSCRIENRGRRPYSRTFDTWAEGVLIS